MSGFLNSSIGRKYTMALSAFFLMIFILQHFAINILSVLNPDTFNETSHFMGTNPLVQYLLQPVLLFGVVYHFVMGFVLEIKNRNARAVKYAKINTKYIQGDMSGLLADGEGYRYYEELVHKFEPIWRVALYCIGFVFLSLHLLHGFSSAFQSVGANNKYVKGLKGFGKAYAVLIPLGFIFIALFHHFNH